MKRNLLAIERAGDYPLVDDVLLLKEEKQRWCVCGTTACRSRAGMNFFSLFEHLTEQAICSSLLNRVSGPILGCVFVSRIQNRS
jgi:hypothetical protein